MAVEAKRGCGWRKANGLYLVGGGLAAPCDRMPYALDRCPTCGAGVKFTRGHTWLQPDFFSVHEAELVSGMVQTGPRASSDPRALPSFTYTSNPIPNPLNESACHDDSPCPVCRNHDDFGPHCLLWIGRSHYSPESFLDEGRRMGVSRRIPAIPKGLVIGETWVLVAHLDAVPAKEPNICTRCELGAAIHVGHPNSVFKKDLFKGGEFTFESNGVERKPCEEFQAPKPTPGIFAAFIPRAVELLLKESDATPERIEKEGKRGVTVVTVPDDDKDHQGSVWDKDEEGSQPELPGVAS